MNNLINVAHFLSEQLSGNFMRNLQKFEVGKKRIVVGRLKTWILRKVLPWR